jgi:hypothetical protein
MLGRCRSPKTSCARWSHHAQLVFGDLRRPNIMVTKTLGRYGNDEWQSTGINPCNLVMILSSTQRLLTQEMPLDYNYDYY